MLELESIRGLPFIYNITLTDQTGQYVDLTDSSITLKVRPTLNSEEVLAECNIQNGGIVLVNPYYGEFKIRIDGNKTKVFPEITVFDCLVITQDGEYYLIAKNGKIKSEDYVSR